MASKQVIYLNERVVKKIGAISVDFAEIRYHSKDIFRISFIDEINYRRTRSEGYHVRLLRNGVWGQSSTEDINGIEETIDKAYKMTSRDAHERVHLSEENANVGNFTIGNKGAIDMENQEESLRHLKDITENGLKSDEFKFCYEVQDFIERKNIWNSEGTDLFLTEYASRFCIFANDGNTTLHVGKESRSSFELVMRSEYPNIIADKLRDDINCHSKYTVLKAGGLSTVVLSPDATGLLIHEILGHLVEADIVATGSPFNNKKGIKISDESLSVKDVGHPDWDEMPAGSILYDDEGIISKDVTLIDRGILNSYLSNRETAFLSDNMSTGNARASNYLSKPIVRMRNTYVVPGDMAAEEMLESTNEVFLIKSCGTGKVNRKGDFVFSVGGIVKYHLGEPSNYYYGGLLHGNVMNVLNAVKGVGKEFKMADIMGECTKNGQPLMVSGGGPALRTELIISPGNITLSEPPA